MTTASWNLILVKEGTQGILKLSKDWTNAPYVYLADKSVGGYIYVSTDMGNTFSTRVAPAGITPTALATPNGFTVYLAGGVSNISNTIYRSTSGAFFWDRQSDARITDIVSLAAPTTDTCIAGGDGAVSYSINGGGTFSRIDNGLASTPVSYQVAADIDYSSTKTIFAGGSVFVAPGNIYRYIIGTSDTWENTQNGNTPGAVVGMSSQRGAFYVMGTSSAGRTINPLVVSPNLPGFISVQGGIVGANWLATAGLPTTNILYAANNGNSPQVWAFNDWLAMTMPKLIDPPNKYIVPVNPATGFAEDVTITWQPSGSGTTLVNTVDFEIYRKTPQYDSGFTQSGIPVNPANPYIKIVAGATTSGNIMGYTMLPGWEYDWDIRVSNTANKAGITSPWSETRSIIVQTGAKISQPYAGLLMTSPATGAVDIDPNLVAFTWAPVSDVTEYQVIIATDAALTETVANTPANVSNTAFKANGLEYRKTYFWAVKATKPVESVQTIGTFTTMEKPPAVTAQPGSTESSTPDTGNFTIPESTGIPAVAWGVFFIGLFLLVILIIRSAFYRRM